ncbi:MAG: hypothetical protein QOI07_54 [Verrucomicrobiota bacterium]|jgi:undecaprenyl pyrophosphate phosphatase UppP
MKMQRTLIFVAAFVLAATTFTPRTGSGKHYYQFVFFVGENASAHVDYQQWVINACVAALVGFLMAQVSRRVLRSVAVVGCVAATATAIILTWNAREARRVEARKRAQSDEIYAQGLLRAGMVREGKEHLRNAAANWRAAGDTEGEKRSLEYERSVKDVFDTLDVNR